MLQYDLTKTRFLEAISSLQLPTEAEMFALTVALLYVREIAYSDLSQCDLIVTPIDAEEIASCIETQFRSFARDFDDAPSLSDRLQNFVGLRIALVGMSNQEKMKAPR